jgi:hypothetical protein
MEKDPDILVDLTTALNDFEAQVIVQALEAQGIPARAFTAATSMLQWQIAPGHGVRISVRRRDLDAARAALRAIRADSVDLDWDEVDTGDRAPPTDSERRAQSRICPSCDYDLHGLPMRVCPECGADLRDTPPAWPRTGLPLWWVLVAFLGVIAVLLLGRSLALWP